MIKLPISSSLLLQLPITIFILNPNSSLPHPPTLKLQGFHDARHEGAIEDHQSGGDYVKAIVFGGLDGILTSFAIVAGSAVGNLSPSVVLVLGFRLVQGGMNMNHDDAHMTIYPNDDMHK